MIRSTMTAALLAALALPLPSAAQDSGRTASGGEPVAGGSAEAQVFLKALEEIGARHRDLFSDSALWAAALDGLIEGLDDPYASVFTPEEVDEFDEQNTGDYTGIGVQITELNGRVTITKVFRSTPADRVGLLEGDVIVGVDESDAGEWTIDTVSDSIRGPAGTDVNVRIEREGFSEPVAFAITRDEVHVPAVLAGVMPGDIAYITLDRVARGSAVEVDSVLREMPEAKALVIDLRRNPGGYLDEALMMSDVFLERGDTLASLRSRTVGAEGTTRESWTARVPARVPGTPIAILVDRFTASAAEIVAGALQDHDRAVILGERTFGKGVVQTVLPLPYNHRLRLTTGTWHTPLGRTLQRPRDAEGRPLQEDPDTFSRVTTESGRELVAAGGIFPDLELPADTLKRVERDFLQAVGEAEIPLGVRIQEFAFDQAQERRADGAPPSLDSEAFEGFLAALADDGAPSDLLEDSTVRDYLAWRVEIVIADRMGDTGAAAYFRMRRDPVLREAVDLLSRSATQPELFGRVDVERAEESIGSASSGGTHP